MKLNIALTKMKSVTAKIRQLYEVPEERSRLIAMEGLRGFAVLLVFFVHLHALFGIYVSSHPFLWGASAMLGNIGNTGVDLFFVLSGYLIYGAVLRKTMPYFKFMKRRVERIYPTFLVVLAIYLLLSLAFPFENKIHGSFVSVTAYLLENAFLLPGIFHIVPIIAVAWSLSYEFFFYLSIPLIVKFTRMRSWKRIARISFFALVWLSYLLYAFTVPRSQVRLLMFVAGILLFELMDSGWVRGKLTKQGEYGAISIFLASLAFVYFYDAHAGWLSFLPGLTAGRTILPGVPTFQGPYKVIALTVSCILFTLYCFEFDGLLKRLFSWNPLRYLGNMSFSYYLIHGLTLHGVAAVTSWIVPVRMRGAWIYFMALSFGFMATWITSTLLFAFIEKPVSLEHRRRAARIW